MSSPPPAGRPETPADTGLDALPDYAPMAAAVLTDGERWPLLGPGELSRVEAWRGHPQAPVWRHACGDRIDADDLAQLTGHAASFAAGPAPVGANGRPGWVDALVERAVRHVPRHRGRRVGFADLEPVCRDDLAAAVASFVPDDLPLERLVQTSSSGTSGAALVLPVHPVTVAAELLLIERIVADAGLEWPVDPDRLALLSCTDQRQAFTYVSALTWRRPQLMARVNLHDEEWARAGDREGFVTACRAQVITGTPLSLLRLARLDLPDLHPLALVPGALTLTPAARSELESRWGATVLDLYGLKETGPFAVSSDGGPHVVVAPRVWVETLAPDGSPVPPGERGEVTVTTDANPYLPLLRYRTGDQAVLVERDGRQALVGLAGRAPVTFRRPDGGTVPSVDLHQQLQHHGAIAWSVTQAGDGSVTAHLVGGDTSRIEAALRLALDRPVTVVGHDKLDALGPGKPRSFHCDLDPTS